VHSIQGGCKLTGETLHERKVQKELSVVESRKGRAQYWEDLAEVPAVSAVVEHAFKLDDEEAREPILALIVAKLLEDCQGAHSLQTIPSR
jgi:hypothetical protein